MSGYISEEAASRRPGFLARSLGSVSWTRRAVPIREFMHVSDTRTISLERPRKAILVLLYVVYCFACIVLGLLLSEAALFVLDRFNNR